MNFTEFTFNISLSELERTIKLNKFSKIVQIDSPPEIPSMAEIGGSPLRNARSRGLTQILRATSKFSKADQESKQKKKENNKKVFMHQKG
mgnify:CR=1 FL=1